MLCVVITATYILSYISGSKYSSDIKQKWVSQCENTPSCQAASYSSTATATLAVFMGFFFKLKITVAQFLKYWMFKSRDGYWQVSGKRTVVPLKFKISGSRIKFSTKFIFINQQQSSAECTVRTNMKRQALSEFLSEARNGVAQRLTAGLERPQESFDGLKNKS